MAVLRLEHVAQAKMVPRQRLAELSRLAVEVAVVPTQTTLAGAADQAVEQVRTTQGEVPLRIVVQLHLDFRIFATPAAQGIKTVLIAVGAVAAQVARELTEQISRRVMEVRDICCHRILVVYTLQGVVVAEMVSPINR